MSQLHKIIATSLGIGYVGKGGGTVAAVITCICWYFWQIHFAPSVWLGFGITLFITIIGTISSDAVEPFWGKDDKKVVIDEVAGMCVSLLFLPSTGAYIIAGLILFRFFDIVKPLYISKAEKLPGGYGVMLDDVLAGICANILLQIAFSFNLL
ncbi:phosphatidylglycerophosphatase A [Dyadobacter sp. CY356]|uniref:phosphatidylglycerophosphatase A family protein n=1 Tax=Dyadobacter sp. CY356 TaxID=2906442 RepID=UPI001F3E0D4D|nr:phosphatidylglycerophosphatase A [Dyadobacter sp. CY356]MCF0057003.1 phosphatidylglycerophosphatase A [Dyadobacter sp. CY356]